jgi:multiple antibiotic resistance protein
VLQELLTEAVTLFVIIDPIGSASIFLSLTANESPQERRRVAFKSVLVATIILATFMIGGRLLLQEMGISITSFQIAGGIVLLIFGLNMVFEFLTEHKPAASQGIQDIAVYPLAMPAIAGPGTIMTVVLIIDNDRDSLSGQAISIATMLAIMVITYLMFRLAMLIHRFIGDTGASIVKKIMDLLLSAVAVDKIVTGLVEYLK